MTAPGGSQRQVRRLLSLLPYLLAHPGAKVDEVARLFNISERQLVSDLNVLWFSGLPGLSMGDLIEVDMDAATERGVITVSNADYLARPLRLGGDEAVALLLGVRALLATPGLIDRDAVLRTLDKLEKSLGDGVVPLVDPLVDVSDDGDDGADAATDAVAVAVREALDTGRLLHLTYWVPGRDETTERDVDPMRLLAVEDRPYLEGWCRLAQGVRLFRLDRVMSIEVLEQPAQVPARAQPRDLSAGVFQPSEQDELVTLELEPAGRWVEEYYPCESTEELGQDRLRVRLRAADPRWVVRLALRLGRTGRIVDPPELVASVQDTARAALAAYAEAGAVEGPAGR